MAGARFCRLCDGGLSSAACFFRAQDSAAVIQDQQARIAALTAAADATTGRLAGLEAALVEGEAAAAAELAEVRRKAAEEVARAEAQVRPDE